ncbi:MAG: hypothetical protein HY554_12540 [Elusimicrobia bacterium]|nr:hypothetical protein [Elusimicrobiota bacterium]
MPSRPDASRLRAALLALAALAIVVLGVRLRATDPRVTAGAVSVSQRYLDVTRWLARGSPPDPAGGGIDLERRRQPPLLAHATVAAYRLVARPFGVSLEALATFLPLLIYLAWLALFWAGAATGEGSREEPRAWVGLAVAALFSVMPASVEATAMGIHAEPLPGAFFLTASTLVLLRSLEPEADARRCAGLGAACVAALILSWRHFPALLAASVVALAMIGRRLTRRTLALWSFVLLAPLGLAALGSRLVGWQYSPVGALGDALRALLLYRTPAASLVLPGVDWASGRQIPFQELGWIGAGLALLGLLRGLAPGASPSLRASAGFAATGLALMLACRHERFAGLALVLPAAARGAGWLFRLDSWPRCLQALREAPARGRTLVESARAGVLASLERRKAFLRWGPLPLLLGGGAFLAAGAFAPAPEPVLLVTGLETPLRLGEARRVRIDLGNAGGPPAKDPNAFAGLHVEVENAEVESASGDSGRSSARIVFEDYARNGNLFLLRASLGRLDPGAAREVRFDIRPYASPVRINYRAWMPRACPRTGATTRPDWRKVTSGGWFYDDACILRVPARDAQRSPCRIPMVGPYGIIEDGACLTVEAKLR